MFGLLDKSYRDPASRFAPVPDALAAEDASDYRLSGFAAGTRLATETGWRSVEALAPGDRVLTFDAGPQPLVAVTRGARLASAGVLPDFANPIHVPIGALGNAEPLVLLPEQAVMIESDIAEEMTGDPFALVPAKALDGYRGIERFRSLRPVASSTLHFAEDQVVFAEGGTLMLAPSAVPGVASLDFLDGGATPAPYPVLHAGMARALVAAMARENADCVGPAAFGAAA